MHVCVPLLQKLSPAGSHVPPVPSRFAPPPDTPAPADALNGQQQPNGASAAPGLRTSSTDTGLAPTVPHVVLQMNELARLADGTDGT